MLIKEKCKIPLLSNLGVPFIIKMAFDHALPSFENRSNTMAYLCNLVKMNEEKEEDPSQANALSGGNN